MARSISPPSFTSPTPTALAHSRLTIHHVQLRDLLVCPRKPGVVTYVRDKSIIEHDLRSPASTPRVISDLSFVPNTIAALPLLDSDTTLIAAGGLDADVHLSLHGPRSSSQDGESPSGALWRFETRLSGSINNSVMFPCMDVTHSSGSGSSSEPRIAFSNNDCTVKFYDIPLRGDLPPKSLNEAGILRLDVAVNHSSISPDGRTLLSVGDSSKVYLHRVTGGRRLTFSPITTLTLPPPMYFPANYSSASPVASFSTAFSSDGSKFAVASQEGSVVVYDVRSSNPLKMFNTDKSRGSDGRDGAMNGSASGWLSDDPWDWSRGSSKAPGWGVRNVKFGGGGGYGHAGKEVMVFTEHTSLVHIVDAQAFDTEQIICMPSTPEKSHSPISSPPLRTRPPSTQQILSNPVFTRSETHDRSSPSIILALQDTFRIPSSDPSSSSSSQAHTARWRTPRLRSAGVGGEPSLPEEDDLVFIPQLGDRLADSGVQRLLERHGIHTPRRDAAYPDSSESPSVGGFITGQDITTPADMDLDEIESDCISSHTPSRAASPAPAPPMVSLPPSPPLSPPGPGPTGNARPIARRGGVVMSRREWAQLSSSRTSGYRDEMDVDPLGGDADPDSEVDLAGVCFDPSGRYLYVASVCGVAEWGLRGTEKRWWGGGSWA